MQRNVNSLIGRSITATDGQIGEVNEFYFDDESWEIRYVIVKTGYWLAGRKVLIPPDVLLKGFSLLEPFSANLTKEQIRFSPDIDTDKSICRQQEMDLHEHYKIKINWESGLCVDMTGINNPFLVIDRRLWAEVDKNDKGPDDVSHLQGTGKIIGYHVHATDGEIGHVKDFIIDDQTWQLEYLVVDIHKWIEEKKVLIPVGQIEVVEWGEFEFYLNIDLHTARNGKLYVV